MSIIVLDGVRDDVFNPRISTFSNAGMLLDILGDLIAPSAILGILGEPPKDEETLEGLGTLRPVGVVEYWP